MCFETLLKCAADSRFFSPAARADALSRIVVGAAHAGPAMSLERRECYRVRADGVSVRARILLPALAGWVPVQVLDTSARGVGVRVQPTIAGHLAVGRIEQVRVHVAATRREVAVRAVIRNLRSDPTGVVAGLDFVDAADAAVLHADAPPQVHALFNRRRSLRIRPSVQQPLRVSLDPGGSCVSAELFDLSTEGIAAVVEPPLALAGPLTIELHLPRENVRATCRGTVVHRLQTGSGVRYGVALDKQHLGYGSVSELAARYVQERQRELLQIPDV